MLDKLEERLKNISLELEKCIATYNTLVGAKTALEQLYDEVAGRKDNESALQNTQNENKNKDKKN